MNYCLSCSQFNALITLLYSKLKGFVLPGMHLNYILEQWKLIPFFNSVVQILIQKLISAVKNSNLDAQVQIWFN